MLSLRYGYLRHTTDLPNRSVSRVFKMYSVWTVSDNSTTEEEQKSARAWLRTFNGVPRNLSKLTFSRSSGPGGQHANKYVTRLLRKMLS
jgi:transposase-like protein